MEAIQLAQMLADLNDLQAAQDQGAAKALVDANKTLDRLEQQAIQNQNPATEGRVTSAPSGASRRGPEKLGRSIFTPPLSRTNSVTPCSVPGTPTRDEGSATDIDKASTLLTLYQIRAKLKEQDNRSLNKARDKVNALAARQQAQSAANNDPRSAHQRTASGNISQIRYPK